MSKRTNFREFLHKTRVPQVNHTRKKPTSTRGDTTTRDSELKKPLERNTPKRFLNII